MRVFMATANLVPSDFDLEYVRRHAAAIRAMVERAHASEPRLIGPLVRGEAPADGRIDLLVNAAPRLSLMKLIGLEAELSELLGVAVDVTTDGGLTGGERKLYSAEALAL